MKTNSNPSTTIRIVSVHDVDPVGILAFDLRQILEALEESVRGYSWVAEWFDSTGECISTGIVLSFDQLIHHARRVGQTIDCTIFGCPSDDLTAADLESITEILDFPKTKARVVILAVDGCYFELIAKDMPIIDQIRQAFRDVRDRDTSGYFTLESS